MTDNSSFYPRQNGGQLTVTRPIENGTHFHEVWVMKGMWWNDEDDMGCPPVRCYILALPNTSPPKQPSTWPEDEYVVDSTNFAAAPEEIQRTFLDQMKRIDTLREQIEDDLEDEDHRE